MAPVGAISNVDEARPAGTLDEVDLFEINEAFAVVTMVAMSELANAPRQGQRPRRRLRPRPPDRRLRCAHPGDAAVGPAPEQASSAAWPAICIGGGEATAMAVECLY